MDKPFAGHRWPLWPGIAALLVALAVNWSGALRDADLKLFDRMMVGTAPGRADLPITIVSIDEASFAHLGLQWPWPRHLHARLLERLKEAGAAVVAFDVLFSEAGPPADDRRFAHAIEDHGSVVLAADLVYEETGAVREWRRVEPLARFVEAGAAVGFASVEIDPDGIQRRVPAGRESFWRQVAGRLERRLPGTVAQFDASPDRHIRYLGGPHTFAYIPYYQLLEPEKYLPANWKDYLKDNIVLIGRDLKASTEVRSAQADMFQTPFFHVARQLMPGVEIHANLIADMVAGETIREAPSAWSWGLWVAAAVSALVLMRTWQPGRSSLAALGLAGGIAVGDYLLFSRYFIWLPATGAISTVILVYLAQGLGGYVKERRQKRLIKQAFSMYVAPSVVEEMIAHPERLKLGGERRELTLLFTDLAGFTSISEGLAPEEVAQLLNRHLAEMTEIVLKHQGTVDKFIGDAVMAFWGAPFADPEQSRNAVAAAIEMQEKAVRMADEIKAAGGPQLAMRIGIHRGECIVGNLGGNKRFDYTAVGDAVNLASRLEGANKAYGTEILLSETVASAVEGQIPLRPIDRVQVKGKQAAIRIFTPCSDMNLISLTQEAWETYRRREWPRAREAWQAVLAACPGDPVASVFLARLGHLEPAGMPAGWDGISRLESK